MRIVGFQIIFVAFSLLAIANVWKRKKDAELGLKGAWFWILFGCSLTWRCFGILESTTLIANRFGIGRGSDFYFVYRDRIDIFYFVSASCKD